MDNEVKQEIESKVSNLYYYCVSKQIPLVLVLGKDNDFLHTAAMWTYEEMVTILAKTIERTCERTQIDCVDFCRELANMLEGKNDDVIA